MDGQNLHFVTEKFIVLGMSTETENSDIKIATSII
jgi:hypothetical protein